MAQEEVLIHSFSGGELSPSMDGRVDLPVYHTGAKAAQNYIIETQGSARYRSGFRVMNHTRENQIARVITFSFNDDQAYNLEFTNKKIRFFRDNSAILVDNALVVDTLPVGVSTLMATFASPHGFAVDDELFLTELDESPEMNNKFYGVSFATSTQTLLNDSDGVLVNPSNYSTPIITAGTRFLKVYELDSPYTEASDFWKLKVRQDGDVMYIVHPLYEPRKLIRVSDANWTLSTYTRTADQSTDSRNVTGFVAGNPGVITVGVAHGMVEGETMYMQEANGTLGSTYNGVPLRCGFLSATTLHFVAEDGFDIDLSGKTWTANGYISSTKNTPTALEFYESRLYFNGGSANPSKFLGSRSPQGSGGADPGATRYDDFTLGTDADHAIAYSIGGGRKIVWFSGTDRVLLIGTLGAVVKVTGDTADDAITSSSVNARDIDKVGAADIEPTNKRNLVFYVQKGGVRVESVQFEALSDAITGTDRNIVASHITRSGILEQAWMTGRPDILWAVRNDGVLVGLTSQVREAVFAWHPHRLTDGGVNKFLSVSTVGRLNKTDQLVVVTERIQGGRTRRFVEYLADDPEMPREQDYFTGVENKASDMARFDLQSAEDQSRFINLDSSITYDGSAIEKGVMFPIQTSGAAVNFLISGGSPLFFTAKMIGQEIWKKPVNGVGTGRAVITGFTDGRNVTCRIIVDFDNADAMLSENWFLTQKDFFGFWEYKDATVQIVTDGRQHPDVVVSSVGEFSLNYQAARMTLGYSYTGHLRTMPLEFGGETGPGQTKIKSVNRLGLRFRETLGVEVGTNTYLPEPIQFTKVPLVSGRPVPLFTGVVEVPFSDSWQRDKTVYVRQTKPYPCTVQALVIHGDTDNT